MRNNRMRIIVTGFIIGALAIIGIAQRTRGTSSAISENALRAHIKFLSDDRLEGRGTGARGGETAALYVAEQFEAMGLKGAGAKGGFWQPVSLVGVKADPKTELRINGREKAEAVKFADEFVAFTGAQTEHVSVNADLVFVGYGIDAPEQKWNDYKGPAEDYRSEEHTSELQSLAYLVCRLLLEKKKKNKVIIEKTNRKWCERSCEA